MLPEPDAIIVAPATFNTINKWAAGIADTLRLACYVRPPGRASQWWCFPFKARLRPGNDTTVTGEPASPPHSVIPSAPHRWTRLL